MEVITYCPKDILMVSVKKTGRFLPLISVIRIHLTTDSKILMLFDLAATLLKSYRISKLVVEMSIIVLFIIKVETDLVSSGECVTK